MLMDENDNDAAREGDIARLQEKIRELEDFRRIVMESLGPAGWELMKTKWERNVRHLAELGREQKQLESKVEEWKNMAVQISRDVRENENLIRQLKSRVAMLEERQGGHQIRNGGRLAHSLLTEIDWMLVLEKLSNGKDLWSCYHTCKQFEVILQPSKVGWAFELALPHFYRLLSGSDMLKCRLVCMRWKDGMDRFLENHPSIQPHNDDDIDPKLLNFIYPVKEMEIGNRNVIRFRNGMDPMDVPARDGMQSWNPFIGRYAILILGHSYFIDNVEAWAQDNGVDGWWGSLYSFLESFGNEIRFLDVISDLDSAMDHGIYHDRMQNISRFLTTDLVGLVPNLQKLTLSSLYWGYGDVPVDAEALPLLPKLETIETTYEEQDAICEGLIQRHHLQLRKLIVSADTWSRIRQLEWPSIKELHVLGFTHSFRNLLGVSMPNLTKLGLTFPYQRGGRTFYASLMEVINELSPTTRLTTLRLQGPVYDRAPEPTEPYLSAPATLKTLEIRDLNYSMDSILMLCFPLIENIHLFSCRYHEEDDAPQLRDFTYTFETSISARSNLPANWPNTCEFLEITQHRGQLYKSSIWEIFPRLNVLTYQSDVYTRDGYEQYSRSQ